MQMSPRNAFGVRYVFDGRSHDRLAQRSSGLRMLLGPSPPSNIRRSIAPSVVGTPAPHAAAPYRVSGFVLWREADFILDRWVAFHYAGLRGEGSTPVPLPPPPLDGQPQIPPNLSAPHPLHYRGREG